MDKYEDLGLEASKFIEDLNMYEASRDGLFRTRRDAGNNPDFEETRKVFASKMTKIHMQKHQEEMARNNQAIKMNGGYNNAHHPRDRPPINSHRQPGESAAKPPILSGPMPGGTAGSQHAQIDGPKHHTGFQSEPSTERASGYGYDHNQQHSPSNSGDAPTHPRQAVGQPWAPSGVSQPPPSSSGLLGASHQQQPHRQPAPPGVPAQQNQAATQPVNRSPPAPSGPAAGWVRETSGPTKPALPLSAVPGSADYHTQQPPAKSALYLGPPSPSYRPSTNQNGPVATSLLLPAPSETPQSRTQAASAASIPAGVPKSSQIPGQSQISGCGRASSAEAEVLSSPKSVQLLCQSLLGQPQEQGPSSAAELKLEALTKRLEKEMDAQPKADYFGKTVYPESTGPDST